VKVGDRVRLKHRHEVTGNIIDYKVDNLFGVDYWHYEVEHDDPNLFPHKMWYEEEFLELYIEELPMGIRCECGVSAVMSNGVHSDYCPLYSSR
jgi:hypothetical protein